MMPDPARIPEHIAVLESLTREHFSPDDLADLLGIGVEVIRKAVRRGELKAFIVDHRIVDITRAEAIRWLQARRAA
jgi:hypothetical protein